MILPPRQNLWAVIRIAVVIAVAANRAAAEPANPDVVRRIDVAIGSVFGPNAPGAVVLIAENQKIILRKSYGLAELDYHVATTSEDVFCVDSLLSQFLAAALLNFVGNGQARLSDSLDDYIAGCPPAWKKVNLADLLAKTSGVPEGQDAVLPVGEDPLAGIRGSPLRFQPGTSWGDGETGYLLVEHVVERLAGENFPQYFNGIFRKLGMSHTEYSARLDLGRTPIAGYLFSRRGPPWKKSDGSGGRYSLTSTVDDLWKWIQAWEAGELVQPKLAVLARQPALLPDGSSTGYGLGWMVTRLGGRAAVENGGSEGAYSTEMAFVPETGLFVAIFCNANRSQVLLASLVEKVASLVSPSAPSPDVNLSWTASRDYPGVYRAADGAKINISLDNGRFGAQRAYYRRNRMTPMSAEEFLLAPAIDERLTFQRDPTDHRISALVFHPHLGMEKRYLRSGGRFFDLPLKLPREVLAGYAGVYELDTGKQVTISLDQDSAGMRLNKIPLVAESASRFHSEKMDFLVEFQSAGSKSMRLSTGDKSYSASKLE